MPDIPPTIITPKSLNDYLEVMSKCVFQAGLAWKVVENKWPGIRESFSDFDIEIIAHYKEADIEALSTDRRVIRNWRKLLAIVSNAQKIIELDQSYGSFRNYLRSHGSFDQTMKAMRRDFKFLGPFGVYAFLYIVGEDVIPHEDFQKLYRK